VRRLRIEAVLLALGVTSCDALRRLDVGYGDAPPKFTQGDVAEIVVASDIVLQDAFDLESYLMNKYGVSVLQ
jgi:hypothetical protein